MTTTEPERIAVLLLAGGRATRFGGGKLLQDLGGKPLGFHAAENLAALDLPIRIAVHGTDTPDLAALGFSPLPLDPADAPLSRSIGIGIGAAEKAGADAVLIALADMPLVPTRHFRALIDAFNGDCTATQVNMRAMVPAIMGKRYFSALGQLSGDRGAQSLLWGKSVVVLSQELAIDIDTPDDLLAARRHLL